jgi:DNA-binding GntR family transcriptional regulator
MEDAREVVQARIVMETGILEQLLEQPRLIDGATLRRHLAEEQKGEREGDAIEVMRLTARFHSIIAGFLRNQWISRHLEQLVLRSLVFVSLYGEAIGPSFCGPAEHRQIARHLLDGDGARASAAMVAHLKAMELFLDFRTERRPARPLAEVFAGPEPKGQ